jgi:hypothetical protein
VAKVTVRPMGHQLVILGQPVDGQVSPHHPRSPEQDRHP